MLQKKLGSEELVRLAREYVAQVLPRATELVFDHGEGMFLFTPEGDRYFDFVGGIAVNALGHCHPEIIDAARTQMERLIHSCFVTGYYESAILLAEKLAEICPGDLSMVFFSNSGAEAVEGSIKMARYITGRPAVISYRGAFHGRTMGATSLTASSVRYRQHYEPLLPSVYHIPFPYCYRCRFNRQPDTCSLDCFEEFEILFAHQLSPDDVAAVIIEPIQGEGGYVPAPTRYLKELRSLCDRHGIMLVFDEIQTGFGRCGDWFAADVYGVEPDILVLAKSIASGFPLSAIVSRPELHKKWPQGAHGSTYGANPVSCAAALTNIKVIERDGLIDHACSLGDLVRSRLNVLRAESDLIGDIRGPGLMIGTEFITPDGSPNGKLVRALIDECLHNQNLLLYSCGVHKQCIRFMPPLNGRPEDVSAGLDRFVEAFQTVAAR